MKTILIIEPRKDKSVRLTVKQGRRKRVSEAHGHAAAFMRSIPDFLFPLRTK